MKPNIRVAIALFFLFAVLVISMEPGRAVLIAADFDLPRVAPTATTTGSSRLSQRSPVRGCAEQPSRNPPNPSIPAAQIPEPITLERFRQPLPPSADASANGSSASTVSTSTSSTSTSPTSTPSTATELTPPTAPSPARTTPTYVPKEVIALADPTNYGDRFRKDVSGRPVNQAPVIVLHETVGSANSVINFFQTPHPLDDDQVSYHTMIALDGRIIYFVPPDKRAFGAGNSVFAGESVFPDAASTVSPEAVQTNPHFPPSVNNFAYHISLETPSDGMNNNDTHSGYTTAQYQSLAWLIAKTDVPNSRITSHKLVDRSRSRKDPRSFSASSLQRLLGGYERTREIVIGCPVAVSAPSTPVNPSSPPIPNPAPRPQ